MQTLEQAKQERKTVILQINIKKFMPNLLWVLKARSNEKTREVLNYLNIDENGFCCTDGRRLHLCSDLTSLPNGLEHGLYQVNICKDVIMFFPKEGEFPKYMDVIPKYDDIEGIKIDLLKSKYDNEMNQRYSTSLIKISALIDYQSTINIVYLKDLEGDIWTVKGKIKSSPIKFVANTKLAIIMPLRMSE